MRVYGSVLWLVPLGIVRTLREQGARFVLVLASVLGFISLTWVMRSTLGLDRHFVAVVALYATFAAQGVAVLADGFALASGRLGLPARVGGLRRRLHRTPRHREPARRRSRVDGLLAASVERGWPRREQVGAYLRSLPDGSLVFCDDATIEILSGLDRHRFDRHWLDDPHTWDLVTNAARAQGVAYVATWTDKMRGHEDVGTIVFRAAKSGRPLDRARRDARRPPPERVRGGSPALSSRSRPMVDPLNPSTLPRAAARRLRRLPGAPRRRAGRRSSSRSSAACSCTRRSSAPPRASSAPSSLRASRPCSASPSKPRRATCRSAPRASRSSARRGRRRRFAPGSSLPSRAWARCSRARSRRGSPPRRAAGAATPSSRPFTRTDGLVRKRVPFVKAIVSIFTLGSGGSGGREGPTMQMGGAIGSLVGQLLKVTERERRILLVAGTAAGMAAVFRTPARRRAPRRRGPSPRRLRGRRARPERPRERRQLLGLHRDLRRAHPLRPRADVPVRPRAPAALRLPRGRRVRSSPAASSRRCGGVQSATARAPVPELVQAGYRGARPRGRRDPAHHAHRAAARTARTGARLPRRRVRRRPARDHRARAGSRWAGAASSSSRILGVLKIVATCLTVGIGRQRRRLRPLARHRRDLRRRVRARGRSCSCTTRRIDPGAFALVGMGTLYGGLAHVPIASLVMTCELAGSYDLLVPLMLAEGIAFVALRHRTLYHAQVADQARLAGAPRGPHLRRAQRDARRRRPRARPSLRVASRRARPRSEVIQKAAAMAWQDVFPVLGRRGQARRHRAQRRAPHDGGQPGPRRAGDRARPHGSAGQRRATPTTCSAPSR